MAQSWTAVKSARELVDRANALSIQTVLRDLFSLSVPDVDAFASYKVNCPFSWEHSDGGMDKNCRVYGSTHLYCFAMHGVLTPVRLVSIQRELRPAKAAEWLLREYNLNRPRPWRERKDELIAAREQKFSVVGNTAMLVEALHMTLQNTEGYADKQYDDEFSNALGEQLDNLDSILGRKHVTEEEVRGWYNDARSALAAVLKEKQ